MPRILTRIFQITSLQVNKREAVYWQPIFKCLRKSYLFYWYMGWRLLVMILQNFPTFQNFNFNLPFLQLSEEINNEKKNYTEVGRIIVVFAHSLVSFLPSQGFEGALIRRRMTEMKRWSIDPQIKSSHSGYRDQTIRIMSIHDTRSQKILISNLVFL